MNIRVRIAPSPTGYMHIGTLRTALYNYLFAKQQKGAFLLRIEDTDRNRFVQDAMDKLIHTMESVGLIYDEGPYKEGTCGPYIQSQRLDVYQLYAKELVDKGHAYYAFDTSEELEAMRQKQIQEKRPPRYEGEARNFTSQQAQERLEQGLPYVIRLKVPKEETVTFQDVIHGEVSFHTNEIDDQILLKSDGYPTYHLAVVIDDHLMKISHVIRGEEWISSTPKHILLYKFFGWELPIFAHIPLILNTDKSKLSKRQGDVAVEDFLAQGFLPSALLNYVALLGWNAGDNQEVFSIDELIQKFDLSQVHKSGAVFDRQKLEWMNGQYIKQLPIEELVRYCHPYLSEAGYDISDENKMKKIVSVAQERLKTVKDIVQESALFFDLPSYDASLLIWKKSDAQDAHRQLKGIFDIVENISEEEFSKEIMEAHIKAYIQEKQIPNGNIFWPFRVALSGQAGSPGPFEIADVLGKEETKNRLKTAIHKLEEII